MAGRAITAIACAVLAAPAPARAMCDVIPSRVQEFRGALGSVNRPYAIPNDDGEEILVRVRPGVCDAGSPGFVDLPGGVEPADDYFVTVLFEPPGDGPRNAVVIESARNGDLGLCAARVEEAAPLPPGVVATCADAVPGRSNLSIRRECVGGSDSGKRCTDGSECQGAGATCQPAVLRFRFPDTDALLGDAADDRTLTGPATIAVTPVSAPLPFGLAAARCADAPGLVACIDELYARGTCETGPDHVDPTFGHFTALPPPNDYQALCTTERTECTGSASELRFTVDVEGNALIPMDYQGVLLRPDGIPVPRLVRGDTSFESFAGGGQAVDLPRGPFLASYSLGGHRLPPIFEPVSDPGSPDALTLFGTVDAPVGVIRIQGRGCVGGPVEGESCSTVDQCGEGGDCQTFFDFSDRLAEDSSGNRVGPVLVPRDEYAIDADSPVPLEGLLETDEMFAFLQLEAIAGATNGGGSVPQDLNCDGDMTDAVLVLRDRETGLVQSIGEASSLGRATARIRQPPFSFPAVAVDGRIAAFLEPEPLQFGNDVNHDGDVFDTILRVYRLRDTCAPAEPCTAEEIDFGLAKAVDAAPLLDGRSVAASDGTVFYRTPEASNARKTTISLPGDNLNGLTISRDRRHIAFEGSTVLRLPPPFRRAFFAYDRDADGDLVFDEPGSTSLAVIDPNLDSRHTLTVQLALSRTGRFAAFSRAGERLELPADVFIRDRDADENGILDEPDGLSTILASTDPNGTPGTGPVSALSATRLSLTADGDQIAFESFASNLVDQDTNDTLDVFVRDRDTDRDGILDEEGAVATVRVNLRPGGGQSPNFSTEPAISADGRYVAFRSNDGQLVADPRAGTSGATVYVRDRDADGNGVFDETAGMHTVRVSVSSGGAPGIGNEPAISDDGRYIAFIGEGGLVPGDTNGVRDVFLHDRDADGNGVFDESGGISTVRVSVASTGAQVTDTGFAGVRQPTVSADGRFVSFLSDSSQLASEDSNGQRDSALPGFVWVT